MIGVVKNVAELKVKLTEIDNEFILIV